MKFEDIIKKVSSAIAAFVVFFIAAGIYLSMKGFDLNEQGELVLVRSAQAQENIPPAPKEIPANFVMPEGHSLGDKNAPLTLYEYSSFGCYHCADFHLVTMPKIKSEYIDKGLVRLVFVPFPIDAASMNGALLAECVGEDKYFAFIEVLFKKQREWGLSRDPNKVLMQYAALSGLNPEKAKMCLKDDNEAREILANRQNGVTQLGIQGTPSFVVGSAEGYQLLAGAQPYEKFVEVFEQKLADKKLTNK